MYRAIRNLLFLFDPEKVHHFSMSMLKAACRIGFMKSILTQIFKPWNQNPVSVFSLKFRNMVGLGAGFDKNAHYLRELDVLGFGFVEIGTVTPKPQGGNEKPRLFRLPKDKALINRMGFNNDGMHAIAERLDIWRKKNPGHPMLIGGNIGKNKTTPNEDAWKDYLLCFESLHPYVDYFVVNVSSPNTPGLRELQDKDSLRKIFSILQEKNKSLQTGKPILLKIAPDLEKEQLDDIIHLAAEISLDGLIVSNTTISRHGLTTPEERVRQIGAGGLSGQPVKSKSTECIRYIAEKTGRRLPVIGSGGIFTASDAKEKIEAGACLVQVWTGFVYEGPGIVKKIIDHI